MAPTTTPPPFVVVVWGDSIAAQKWPEQAEHLHNVALNTGRAIQVVNKGVGGMPAAVARGQFDTAVRPHRPHLIIIQFGFNDLRHDGTRGALPLSTPEEFEDHLTAMTAAGRDQAGAQMLLYGNHRARSLVTLPTGRGYDETRALYNGCVKRVAARMGVRFRDMAETFERAGVPYTEVVCEDGVHLSPFGVQAYAAVAAGDIRECVSAART